LANAPNNSVMLAFKTPSGAVKKFE